MDQDRSLGSRTSLQPQVERQPDPSSHTQHIARHCPAPGGLPLFCKWEMEGQRGQATPHSQKH